MGLNVGPPLVTCFTWLDMKGGQLLCGSARGCLTLESAAKPIPGEEGGSLIVK